MADWNRRYSKIWQQHLLKLVFMGRKRISQEFRVCDCNAHRGSCQCSAGASTPWHHQGQDSFPWGHRVPSLAGSILGACAKVAGIQIYCYFKRNCLCRSSNVVEAQQSKGQFTADKTQNPFRHGVDSVSEAVSNLNDSVML